MDTKALRQKILDLAIRGKLVPQDPNDEPASVLLERIRAEKQQMVKDGKLKPKDIKNDTVIFKGDDNLHYEKFSGGTVKCIEDEIPFDVPNNWEWCRFGSYTLNRDSERKPVSSVQRKKVKKIYDYYGASGVIDQTDSFLFDEELLLIGEDGANLLARTKPIAFLADGKYWVNNHAHCIDSIDKRLLKFICIYINAINLFQYITGSAQPKLNQDNMNKILIPIPPKAEQEKILESIKIILSNINDIDLLKGKLQSNIANAKSKILDLAIRGKLVPQNPNDEPASVLLERIRAEKEELIKQGKIKRDKKESVIFKGDDNSYYQDLPETWELVNFKDCATLISGRDLNKNEYNAESIGIPYITGASNFINENILINRWTTVPKIVSEVNDILITCKGTVGELAINKYGNIHIARQIMAIRIYKNINLEYIKFFLESIVMEIKKTANGLIPGISRDDILSLNIPLPPLAEQKRIVDEIEKIFATLDDIANQVA
jgi:type I restriction enzyme S subunit